MTEYAVPTPNTAAMLCGAGCLPTTHISKRPQEARSPHLSHLPLKSSHTLCRHLQARVVLLRHLSTRAGDSSPNASLPHPLEKHNAPMPKDRENAFPVEEAGPGPRRERSSPSAEPPQTPLTSVPQQRGAPSHHNHP